MCDAIRKGEARVPLIEKLLSSSKPLDAETPLTPSFVHLHLGIKADGLSLDELKSIHHINVPEWSKLTAPQSAAFVSMPSLLDPSLAPDGCHVIHAYLPATEPYEVWEGLDRKSDEYKALKEERSQKLWEAVEKFIPDIRERAIVSSGDRLCRFSMATAFSSSAGWRSGQCAIASSATESDS